MNLEIQNTDFETNAIYINCFDINLFCCIKTYGQNISKKITLDEVVNVLSFNSSAAKIERLNFQNEIFQFENYKKS